MQTAYKAVVEVLSHPLALMTRRGRGVLSTQVSDTAILAIARGGFKASGACARPGSSPADGHGAQPAHRVLRHLDVDTSTRRVPYDDRSLAGRVGSTEGADHGSVNRASRAEVDLRSSAARFRSGPAGGPAGRRFRAGLIPGQVA